MGTVYRRQVRFCTTCDRRLDTTAARRVWLVINDVPRAAWAPAIAE